MTRSRRLLIIYSVVLTFVAIFFVIKRIAFQYTLDHTPAYDNWGPANEIYQSIPLDTGQLIFAGDSRVAYSPFAEWFPAAVNRGIPGECAYQLVKRLPSLLQWKPRAMVVCIGINDIAQHRKDIYASFDSIFRLCHVPLYLMEVMPVATVHPGAVWINQQVDSVNKFLRNRKERYHFTLLQVFGSPLDPFVTWDGVHFNAKGYAQWFMCLARQVPGKYNFMEVNSDYNLSR